MYAADAHVASPIESWLLRLELKFRTSPKKSQLRRHSSTRSPRLGSSPKKSIRLGRRPHQHHGINCINISCAWIHVPDICIPAHITEHAVLAFVVYQWPVEDPAIWDAGITSMQWDLHRAFESAAQLSHVLERACPVLCNSLRDCLSRACCIAK
jgi:hypothetical protein